jgi:hypothetical protein
LLAEVFRARKLPGRLTIGNAAFRHRWVWQCTAGHAGRHLPHYAERVEIGLRDLHIVRSRIVRLRRRRGENNY